MNDLPFYPLSQFYKSKFGLKLQKIPVTLASTCPNREGLKGMQTCIFCDEYGSSAYPEQRFQDFTEQISDKISLLGHHRSAKDFLIYFQTYTSTFLAVQKLRESFDKALIFPEVKGLIVGTRPDCISESFLALLNEYKSKTYIAVELGVQSFDDQKLTFLKRGHTAQCSIDAINNIFEKTQVDIGIHLIFGLPQETDADASFAALTVNRLPLKHVKLHNLHVLKNTELEVLHREGKFSPLNLEDYSQRIIHFLENLRPDVSVERLAALSSHWDELVAPDWTKHKLKTREFIISKMRSSGSFQGKLVRSGNYGRVQVQPQISAPPI